MTPPTLGSTNTLDGIPSSFTVEFGFDPACEREALLDASRAHNNAQRFELCLKEVDQLQTIITWYDEAVLRKKSWGLAVWAIVTALGIQNANAMIVLIGLAALAGFATSELILRRYQRRYVVRAEVIDEILAQGNLRQYQFSLTAIAGRSERAREIWYALTQPHFTLFYGFFAAISAASAVYFASWRLTG